MTKQIKTTGVVPMRLTAAMMAGAITFPALAADYIVADNQQHDAQFVHPHESILAEDVPFGAPNAKPPPYTILRYTERYSYLADPAKRIDPFDTYKYIPLAPENTESYLSFGGEIRERYEQYHNQAFGIKGAASDHYGLQRIMLHADLHANERLRFFVQGISSVQFGGEQKLDVNQNPLDLQQAFVDYTFGDPSPNGNRQTVRAGRFSMSYGSGRLIATRAGPNTQLKFDGLQFIHSNEGNKKLYAFIARPVKEDRYEADRPNQAQSFSGIYASTPLNATSGASVDAYYLNYRNEEAAYVGAKGVENRHTLGMRWFGKTGQWDYDWEAVAQLGEVGDQEIRAWTFASDTGYTFADTAWHPRLGIKADIASGDRNKKDGKLETFNPLFFKANYFNDAAFFRPANLADIHASLQMQPREDLTITFGSDFIWKHSKQDAIYATTGRVLLPATDASKYVGTALEAAAQWKVNRHMVATASYVHMYTGSQVDKAGGGDIDYLATWVSFIW
ncbi:alginate export family protein [Methylotenera oryzisoli]|uniref:Alginate export family protein n=1 Tax=Methylotenera oryzisoli TaxID=2080758 RepID=A0A4Y9VSZ0_9PROT|nr:alginate export family protein [Methylotenera oryzisoli]TFW72282.1 alginate export family protein [Methylotenera oryzisoli]